MGARVVPVGAARENRSRARVMQKLDGQLITVFGGGGFVGRYVVQKLLARGARVRVAQREPRQATFLKPLGGLGQMQFVAVDVREATGVARAVQGARKSTRVNSRH